MIEARIVEASDNFSKNLGARLGYNEVGADGTRPPFGSCEQPLARYAFGVGSSATSIRTQSAARSSPDAGAPRRPERQPAGGRPERRSTPGAFSLHPVQRGADPVPQPGDLGAGGRRQGQDHLQPARADRGPGRGADRAGHGNSVPAGDLLGRDQRVVPQGQPVAQGEAADHARRQHHHDAGREQGRAGRDHRRRASRSTPSTSRPRCWSRTAARW